MTWSFLKSLLKVDRSRLGEDCQSCYWLRLGELAGHSKSSRLDGEYRLPGRLEKKTEDGSLGEKEEEQRELASVTAVACGVD